MAGFFRLGTFGLGARGAGGFDYYVDDATGNDANDGLTAATAWQSLSKITGDLIETGEAKRVLVKSGTYDKANDNLHVDVGTKTGTTFIVTFEAGCTIDGTAFTEATQNGVGYRVDTASDRTNNFYCYGNGCVIQNITSTDGNGIDGSGGGIAHYYDFEIVNARDGLSIHETQLAKFYRVNVSDCLKWAVAHVGDCETEHYGCSFADENNTATLGGLVAFRATGGTVCEDTIFLPGTTTESRNLSVEGGPGTFTRCRLGTLSRRVELAPYAGGSVSVSKSFLNANYDGIYTAATIDQCFGKFTVRPGASGGGLTVTNSVIVGPTTGQTNVIYCNYTPASTAQVIFNNNIVEMGSAFMTLNADVSTKLVSASSQFHNNALSGGAVYDADLVGAGADIVGTVTSDPLIGAANTLLMADYAYAAGSPCIGAGTSGSNIGFGAADVEELSA